MQRQEENIIKITKCDNQLLIYAVSVNQEIYEIVKVGDGASVNVNVALTKGDFTQPLPIINPTEPSSTTVKLPAGTYNIYYSGFNCGGPYNYNFELNNVPYLLKNDEPEYGFIWNKGGTSLSTITVTI